MASPTFGEDNTSGEHFSFPFMLFTNAGLRGRRWLFSHDVSFFRTFASLNQICFYRRDERRLHWQTSTTKNTQAKMCEMGVRQSSRWIARVGTAYCKLCYCLFVRKNENSPKTRSTTVVVYFIRSMDIIDGKGYWTAGLRVVTTAAVSLMLWGGFGLPAVLTVGFCPVLWDNAWRLAAARIFSKTRVTWLLLPGWAVAKLKVIQEGPPRDTSLLWQPLKPRRLPHRLKYKPKTTTYYEPYIYITDCKTKAILLLS